MPEVRFLHPQCRINVPEGTLLLDAAVEAGIELNTQCGGEGICGKCIMIVRKGNIPNRERWTFSEKEFKEGYVLSCRSAVVEDLEVSIPWRTAAHKGKVHTAPAEEIYSQSPYIHLPVVQKVYLELEEPTLNSGQADHQLVCREVKEILELPTLQMGLKTIRSLPDILRNSGYKVTVTVGLRRDIAEIMSVEGGDRTAFNFLVVVDAGTTTLVAELVNGTDRKVLDRVSCYNCQSAHGAEITARMIHSERKGIGELQELLVHDINVLIGKLCDRNHISRDDITAVVCAGNTAVSHFLLGLPTNNIRRKPFVPVTVDPPPFRASETGLEINKRGLLYSLPGISGWVGGDLTAGILATQMHMSEGISLLVDIGTNGEVILGGREWLIAASASAGPALEGASVQCGMRAEQGAVDRVYLEKGEIRYGTIDDEPAVGICGSGILDLISVLLEKEIINRSGVFIDEKAVIKLEDTGTKAFVLEKDAVYITEKDMENIITAKAAIFSAINILLDRMSLHYKDLNRIYIAGAFGNYLNRKSAVSIGLLPPVSEDKIHFVGNTSLTGAAMAALHQEAFYELSRIREMTTYYDLLGALDYVEEFQKAMFLPHTDIDYWRRLE